MKKPKEPLDTFVADCLRIIKARRLERLAAIKEEALRVILNQERNHVP